MYFLKTLFFNFLIVFFANYILPGVEMMDRTKIPHIGGDIIFSIALGLLNSLIYPALKVLKQEPSYLKVGLISLILNFLSYAIVKLLPVGVNIMSLEGYLLVSLVVSIGSFVTSFFEMKHYQNQGQINPGAPS